MRIEVLEKSKMEQIKKGITSIFDGENKTLNVSNIAPSVMIELIEKAGGKVLEDEMSFNGWYCDFWVPVTFKSLKLTLSGSAFYGTLTLSID